MNLRLAAVLLVACLPLAAFADRPDQLTLADPFPGDKDLAPTLISLDIKSASPEDALAALNAAAKVQYKFAPAKPDTAAPGSAPAFSLAAKERPLLEVLLQFRAQARLGMPTPRATDQQLLDVSTTGPELGAWCVSGPFGFTCETTNVSMTLGTDGSAKTADVSMHIIPVFEPRIRIISFPGGLKLLQVEDEKGHSLIAGQLAEADIIPRGLRARGSEGISQNSDLFVDLVFPKDAGKRIALFKATAAYVVQLQSAVVETKEPGTAITRTIGKFDYTIGPFTPGPPMALPVTVKRGTASDEDWASITRVLRTFRPSLNNAPGGRPILGRNPTVNDQAGVFTISYDFPSTPARVGPTPPITDYRIELPGDLRRVEVPLEFHNLPLP